MNQKQVEFREKIFEVEYDYTPAEKEVTYYADGSGYPGCPAQVYINRVMYNGEDFSDFIFASEKDCEDIENIILKEISDMKMPDF